MKRFYTTYCLILGLLMATTGFAQEHSTTATEAFVAHFDSLYKEGNRCYVALGNAARLQRVIDEMQAYVNQGRADGIIDRETADEKLITLRMDKLQGDLYYLRTDEDASAYGTSERYFKTALNFAQDTAHARIGNIYYYTFILHEELAQLYYKQGRYQQAYDEMKEAQKSSTNFGGDVLLDFISQMAICEARVGQFVQALDDIQVVLDNYEGTDTERYGEAMRKKAKILMLQQEQGNEDTGMAAPTDDALRCYKEYFALKKADALQRFDSMTTEEREPYWMSIRPFVVDCYRLEDADPSFLYDVTLFSKGLLLELNREGGGQQALAATWRDVQKKLSKKDCAIEFIQYEKNGKQHMAALVLRKTGEPQFVRMTSPDEVLNFKIGNKTVEERLQTVRGGDRKTALNRLYNDTENIPQMLWPEELMQAIGKSRNVWFAPDGYQHRMAIEYILPQSAKFNCHRLTSTRVLLAEATTHNNGSALIIGGVDYNHNDSIAMVSSGNDSDAYSHLSRMRSIFRDLEGSRKESSAIDSIRHHEGDTLLQGAAASESAFRQLSGDYCLILVSTHGVFHAAAAPLGTDLKPCLTDNSLSESLLALSGINTNLGNDSFDAETFDGVLSAREIASLDLSSVDLVVLSCCESGLGHITADGVYGIQRGFKNAGAKALIVTLWEIDDNKTVEFMKHLNQKMGEGKSIYEAFYSARNLLKDEDPVYRDAFILIDAL